MRRFWSMLRRHILFFRGHLRGRDALVSAIGPSCGILVVDGRETGIMTIHDACECEEWHPRWLPTTYSSELVRKETSAHDDSSSEAWCYCI
jgi:hypothetical protein